MNRRALLAVPLCALLLASLAAGPAGPRPAPTVPSGFRNYNTAYYLMRTDVSEEMAREAQLRVDKMFEEYTIRTASFARPVRDKFPLFLFSNKADYTAAGGPTGSGGVFQGAYGPQGAAGRLMAVARGEVRTWHVLQHEGFHQFAFMSISPKLPIWANEGLAEYFGEGIYTGDAMVCGLIPDGRRAEVVAMIREGTYTPLKDFVEVTGEEWGASIKHANYTQAWAMVHFLAHGDNGKYQKAFATYMSMLSKGVAPARAWAAQFGVATGDASFETAWKKWWLALPEKPTANHYDEARAMMFTSFIARATNPAAASKHYEKFADFLKDAQARTLKLPVDGPRWLPANLLEMALAGPAPDPADFTIKWTGATPVLTQKVGEATLTVEYKNGRTVATVKEPPKAAPRAATRAATSPATASAP